MDGGGAPQMAPFRFNTRERIKKVGQIDYPAAGGDGVSLLLPQIGLLARIVLVFEGSVTFSSATTYGNFGPWAVWKRLRLDLNNASQNLFDVTGFGAYLMSSVLRKVNKIDETAGLDANLYAAPTSGSAQSIKISVEIPVNQSQGLNFQAGLINLQAPEVQATMNISYAAALSDIGSNITAFSGTTYVYYKFFEVPDPTAVVIPPVILHKWIEQQQPITAVGENIYTLPRAGKLARLIHCVTLNGARSDSYDSAILRVNQSDTVYNRDKRAVKWDHRAWYGQAMPVGVVVNDFSQGYMVCEESDARDFFDTERVTTTESVITVSSGASLGSNNNTLVSIREILQVPSA
jgi:hypothetical protein